MDIEKTETRAKAPVFFHAKEYIRMSLIDEVKKSISEDLGEIKETASGIKTAGELMTDQSGDIDIDQILKEAPTDEKGNKIVEDHIFDNYYKKLPNGTWNKSHTKMAVNGGILKPLGSDPEADRDIHRKGGEALQAKMKQRLSMSETLDILLRQPADAETIENLHLPAGATKQDALLAAMYLQATEGNVKAGQFVRDTIGEQPTAKQDISLQMTDDDRSLLEKVENRLNG